MFALVVSLLASTKRVRQAAYATLATQVRQVQPRRDSGARRRTAIAAIPDRAHATWNPVSVVILMAAPPVEKIAAAPMAPSRARAWVDMGAGKVLPAVPAGRYLSRMILRTLGSLGLLAVLAARLAGQAAPAPRPDPAWMSVDRAGRAVTFELIAGMTTANGSLNFNGQKGGALTFVVPRGWRVTLDFSNRDKNLPHSAQVIGGTGAVPMGPGTPAFPGASSTEPATGVPATAPMEPIRFVAGTAGEYRIFCAVPGHGMAGMWVKLKVDPSATLPSVTID